jgi:uncharacterized protein
VKTVEWVVKASKLCNLRCAYCYEWNSLADPHRIAVDEWRRILAAIRGYHVLLDRQLGRPIETRLIWHGGEPLLLPAPYLDEVMAIQHEMLAGLPHRLLLQTNLYRVSDAHLEVVARHDVGLGVSLDVVAGVRLNAAGRETRSAVVANLDRLTALGVPYGAITVAARHNIGRLREVHDFWARRGIGFRVLPLFQGPDERPAGAFEVSDDDLAIALSDLFDHWVESGTLIDVAPLSEWLVDVLRKLVGLRVPTYDRGAGGERVLLVETNGDLLTTDERGVADARLGNLFVESMEQILTGPRYAASLARTEAKTARVCAGCRHVGFCDGYPAHAEPFDELPGGRCPVTAAVHDHIERYLLGNGFGPDRLLGWLRAAATAA